jgi:hypothetical protein
MSASRPRKSRAISRSARQQIVLDGREKVGVETDDRQITLKALGSRTERARTADVEAAAIQVGDLGVTG